MATTHHVVRIDDLDSSTDDVQPVWIGLRGQLWEVDLRAAHRRQLRELLSRYAAHARPLNLEPAEPAEPVDPAGEVHLETEGPQDVLIDVAYDGDDVNVSAALSTTERSQLAASLTAQAGLIAHLRTHGAHHTQNGQDTERAEPPESPESAGPAGPASGARPTRQARPSARPQSPHPWIPLVKVERRLAEQVRHWAEEQGICLPHRGVPRSVLDAWRRRDNTSTCTAPAVGAVDRQQ